jgi:hypothetical protein
MLLDLATQSVESAVQLILQSNPPIAFVQAQDPSDDPLQRAIAKMANSKVKIRFTFSPPAAYALDAQGQPFGRTGYAESTRNDLEKMSDYGDIIVTPRFTEMYATPPRLGVQSHAFYVATPKVAMLCTATPSQINRITPICLLSYDDLVIKGLVSLHSLDFEFNMPKAKAAQLNSQTKLSLVYSPEYVNPLTSLAKLSGLVISTQDITDPSVLESLMKNAKTHTLVLPSGQQVPPSFAKLQAAGATLLRRSFNHGGTIIVGADLAYIGSHRLQTLHLSYSRDVGVILSTKDHPKLLALALGKPA